MRWKSTVDYPWKSTSTCPLPAEARKFSGFGAKPALSPDYKGLIYHWRDPDFKETHQAKIHFHERPDTKTAFDFKGPNRIQYECWTKLAATAEGLKTRWMAIGVVDFDRLQPQEQKLVAAVFIDGRTIGSVAREYQKSASQFGISYAKAIQVLDRALTVLAQPPVIATKNTRPVSSPDSYIQIAG